MQHVFMCIHTHKIICICIKPKSPALQADSLLSGPPRKPSLHVHICICVIFFTNGNILCILFCTLHFSLESSWRAVPYQNIKNPLIVLSSCMVCHYMYVL